MNFGNANWTNPYKGLLGTVNPTQIPGLGGAAQASNNPPHRVMPGAPNPQPAPGHDQYHVNNNPLWSLLKMDPNPQHDPNDPNSPVWVGNPLQGPNPHDPTTDPGGPNASAPTTPTAPAASSVTQSPDLDWSLWFSSVQPERGEAWRVRPHTGNYRSALLSGKRNQFGNVSTAVRSGSTGAKQYSGLRDYAGAPVWNKSGNLMGYYSGSGNTKKAILSAAQAQKRGLISDAAQIKSRFGKKIYERL